MGEIVYCIEKSEYEDGFCPDKNRKRYKIGMSENKHTDFRRIKDYKGAKIHSVNEVDDAKKMEGHILYTFKKKFKLVSGNETFVKH